MAERYVKPGWFTGHVFNPTVHALTRMGVSVWGSRVLAVKGRSSGEVRSTPVNVLDFGANRYLVAPRGQTQWVKNIRVAGEAELRRGRSIERVRAIELGDEDKPPILRAYLKRWRAEVGIFFGGVGAQSSDDELLAIAPNHPVFRLEKAD